MVSIIFRTIFFYFFVAILYRIMGKRELGQLGLLDLVVSILIAELAAMAEQHPEHFDEKTGEYIGPSYMSECKDREEADATFTGFDVCEELADYGFTNLEKIIVPTGEIAEAEKNLICEENLTSLKINALLKLDENLSVKLTEKEKSLSNLLSMYPFMVWQDFLQCSWLDVITF